jgi:hypothetical protein
MDNYENFIDWILEKRKVYITYFSKKDNKNVVRLSAPFDFWPKRKSKSDNCSEYIDNWNDKYHFWDFDGSRWWHISSKNIDEIIKIELLDNNFEPKQLIDFSKIKCDWHIERNW